MLRVLAVFFGVPGAIGLLLTASRPVQTVLVKPYAVVMRAGHNSASASLASLVLAAALQGPLPARAELNKMDAPPPPSFLLAGAEDFQAKEAAKQAKARAAVEARRQKQAEQEELKSQVWAATEAAKAERMAGSALGKNTKAKAIEAKEKAEAVAKASAKEQEEAAAKAKAAEEALAQVQAQQEADDAEKAAALKARAEERATAQTAAEKAKAEKIAAIAQAKADQEKAIAEGKAARAAETAAFLEKRKAAQGF